MRVDPGVRVYHLVLVASRRHTLYSVKIDLLINILIHSVCTAYVYIFKRLVVWYFV